MTISLLNPKVTTRIVNDIRSQETTDRTEREYGAHISYNGALKPMVANRLEDLFPDDFKVMEVSDVNLGKKIVDKQAQSYKEGVHREITGASKEKNDEFQKIVTDGDLDNAMVEFDKLIHINKYCCMWITMREETIFFEPIPAYSFFPIINQDTK